MWTKSPLTLLAALILGAFTATLLLLVGMSRRGAPLIDNGGWRELELVDSV